MNTLEIKLSKKIAETKVKPILKTVELFLARKNIFLTEEELKTLSEDMAFYLQSINLIIEEN